jgi:hypothetical protein
MSQKKVQTENPYIVEKVRAEYREPEDVRESGRIAGKSANPLDPRPRGQYKRDELSLAGPDTMLVQSSNSRGPDQRRIDMRVEPI